jgi:hypothetical protein
MVRGRRLIKYPPPCKEPGERYWRFKIRDARGDGEDVSWIVDCEHQDECIVKPLSNIECGSIDRLDYDKLRDMICEVLEGQERQPIRRDERVLESPPTGPPLGVPKTPIPKERRVLVSEVRKHPRWKQLQKESVDW